MREKMIRLGYLLGLALILSGILYFFASNWPGFDRFTKIALSILFILLFYASSFIMRKLVPHQAFLSHWLLLCGGIAFGLSIALVGQIYNSHADHYLLFFIWLLPMVFFSFVTSYQGFYFLSFVLLQLTMWLFINPSLLAMQRGQNEILLLSVGMSLVNFVLFFFTTKNIISSAILKYSSYLMFHVVLLSIAVPFEQSLLRTLIAVCYFAVLCFLFYYFSKIHSNKKLLSITIIAASLFVIRQLALFIMENFEEWALVLSFLFVVALVFASVLFINWLNQNMSGKEGKSLLIIKRVAIVGITAVASIIGTLSIVGLIFLATGDYPTNGLFFLGIGFTLLFFIIKSDVPTVKYTLLLIGVFMSGAASFFVTDILFFMFIAFLFVLLFVSKSIAFRLLAFTIIQTLLLSNLPFRFAEFIHIEAVLLGLVVVNGIVYAKIKHPILKKLALVLSFSFLLSLTETASSSALTIGYSLLFFLVSTLMVFMTYKRGYSSDFGISIGFWFLFLGMKYYDYLWDLFDKSLLLLIVGLIFLVISKAFDPKANTAAAPSFLDQNRRLLAGVIVLQLVIIGCIVARNETVLQNGTEIKLALEPLDPRSLIQGDYVILNYEISDIEIPKAAFRERVKIVLRKNNEGIHEYANFYNRNDQWNRPYKPKTSDVIITGTYHMGNIAYGIENFFIPEGTGQKVESEARFAKVRVGKNGNAILVDLTKK
ncbi:DUF2157 domain-containing protein [Priestia megaterium]|nr:DUF2157 domain-containing protein [Priestia megaterium]